MRDLDLALTKNATFARFVRSSGLSRFRENPNRPAAYPGRLVLGRGWVGGWGGGLAPVAHRLGPTFVRTRRDQPRGRLLVRNSTRGRTRRSTKCVYVVAAVPAFQKCLARRPRVYAPISCSNLRPIPCRYLALFGWRCSFPALGGSSPAAGSPAGSPAAGDSAAFLISGESDAGESAAGESAAGESAGGTRRGESAAFLIFGGIRRGTPPRGNPPGESAAGNPPLF